MSDKRRNYALEPRPLAIGGQAEIFRATDKRTGQIVAFKRILDKYDPDAQARMRHEVDVQTSISHPNIMPIIESSEHFRWYTMPLAIQTVGHLTPPVKDHLLIEIVEDSAKGLQAGHENNYTHRDIKPANILQIDTDNQLRWVVADWGLVRAQMGRPQKYEPYQVNHSELLVSLPRNCGLMLIKQINVRTSIA
jgi:serine/threonine protein kinase